jgi:hypothetical protein
VFFIKERTLIEGIENRVLRRTIWTYEGGSGRRLENTE